MVYYQFGVSSSFFFLMRRRPPRSTPLYSSAASDVYKRQVLLEQEAQNAFEERKHAAKRYGEEAGTKLLFPMMLMLGIVMVILLVPAVLAFQI